MKKTMTREMLSNHYVMEEAIRDRADSSADFHKILENIYCVITNGFRNNPDKGKTYTASELGVKGGQIRVLKEVGVLVKVGENPKAVLVNGKAYVQTTGIYTVNTEALAVFKRICVEGVQQHWLDLNCRVARLTLELDKAKEELKALDKDIFHC